MGDIDFSIFLPRRLSHPGCVAAGTQLGTKHEALKKDLKSAKVKLPAKIEDAVEKVRATTTTLSSVPSNDATMTEIDRGTDRCIAGFHDQLDAIERSFSHGSILALSDADAARLADATLIRTKALPEGTGFIKHVYRLQWSRMTTMVNALEAEDVAAAITRLGLTLEAARVKGWAGLYGAKLGLTEVKTADPSVTAVQTWHDAYGALFAHVHSEYGDAKDDQHAMIRAALLSPYTDQAEEERKSDQKSKSKAKKAGASGAEGE